MFSICLIETKQTDRPLKMALAAACRGCWEAKVAFVAVCGEAMYFSITGKPGVKTTHYAISLFVEKFLGLI